jgi:hypothetical protein
LRIAFLPPRLAGDLRDRFFAHFGGVLFFDQIFSRLNIQPCRFINSPLSGRTRATARCNLVCRGVAVAARALAAIETLAYLRDQLPTR